MLSNPIKFYFWEKKYTKMSSVVLSVWQISNGFSFSLFLPFSLPPFLPCFLPCFLPSFFPVFLSSLSFFIPSFLSSFYSFFLIFIMRTFEINKKDCQVTPVENYALFRAQSSMRSDFSLSLPVSYSRLYKVQVTTSKANTAACRHTQYQFCPVELQSSLLLSFGKTGSVPICKFISTFPYFI